jgi:hypothetical protein
MSRRVVSVVLDLVRGSALCAAAAGAGTVAVYTWHRPWVESFDKVLADATVGSLQRRVLAAIERLEKDRPGAIADFERLRAENSGYAVGDQQEKAWAIATLFLSQQMLQEGKRDAAIRLANEVADARPQDLSMQFLLTDVLGAAGDSAERDEHLRALFARLPEHPEVAKRMLLACTSQQHWAEAGRVIAAHLRRPPPFAFELAYSVADQSAAGAMMQRAYLLPQLADDGGLALRFLVPAGTTTLDVRLPPNGHYDLRAPLLALGELRLPPAEPAGAQALVQVRGDDGPRLHFVLPAPLAAQTEGQVTARIGSRTPDWLATALAEPAVASILGALADDAAAARAVDRHRRLLLLQTATSAAGSGPGGAREYPLEFAGGFAAPGATPCALRVAVGATVQSLDLPWPAARAPVDEPPPQVQIEPQPAVAPAVERRGDRLHVEFAAPVRVDTAVAVLRV